MIKRKSRRLEKKNLVVIFMLSISIAFWVFCKEDRSYLVGKIYQPKDIYVKLQRKEKKSEVYKLPAGSTYSDLFLFAEEFGKLETENTPLDLELSNGQVVQTDR